MCTACTRQPRGGRSARSPGRGTWESRPPLYATTRRASVAMPSARARISWRSCGENGVSMFFKLPELQQPLVALFEQPFDGCRAERVERAPERGFEHGGHGVDVAVGAAQRLAHDFVHEPQ